MEYWTNENVDLDGEYGVVEHPNSGGVARNVPSVVAIGKGINISFLFYPLVGRQGYPGVTVSENCIKLTAGRGQEQLSYAGSSMQNATRSQEPDSMRTSYTSEAGKWNGEGIVAAARTRKRKASSHQLRDFPPVANRHGDRKLPRPIAACILEATVHPWWLHPRDLGHLTVSTHPENCSQPTGSTSSTLRDGLR